MSKTHVIGGKTYVEVDRKAEVGDKIKSYSDRSGELYTVKDVDGYFAIVARSFGHVHGFFHDDYVVLAEVGEEVTVDTSQASPAVIEMFTALSRKIVSLESQLRDTQRNVERQAEELEELKRGVGHIEVLTLSNEDDIRELDERTQSKEDAPEDTVTLPRWVVDYLIEGASR